MRTPHPVVAESLSGEFEREAREAPLRARIAELEGKLAEAEAVQAEVLGMAESALSVLDGDGELALVGGYLGDIAALNDSPLAQALARLVEAAIQARPYARFTLELRDAVDAYQAARSGRGEGE